MLSFGVEGKSRGLAKRISDSITRQIFNELQDEVIELIYKKQIGRRVRVRKMLEIMVLEVDKENNIIDLHFRGVPQHVRTEQRILLETARNVVRKVKA